MTDTGPLPPYKPLYDPASQAAARDETPYTPNPRPDVQGRCPACGWESLFLGSGGYITCSRLECPDPNAASTLLEHDVWATHDAGPTVAEAAADDAAHWTAKYDRP